MSGRSTLKKEVLLCGESDGSVFRRKFSIVKKIDEGASVICYEAYHGNSSHGILKEFYPREAFGIERDKNGQISHSPEFGEAYNRFELAKKEYMQPYKMLLAAKREDDSKELSTFIPPFEIYHGCNAAGQPAGTVYIWTPEPELETFDKLCDEIHKHPTQKPEHKLVTVLNAVDTLTKCICLLHKADMLHRDIKPSNFGFVKRGDATLTQTLSLFDINTICSVYGNLDTGMGSPGYLEPEASYEIATNQTDIFAIGATLFHAIIVSEETKDNGYLYQSGYYDQIQSLVDSSKLIQASEANSHPRLRNVLARILKKCLCERTHRYQNCEELIEDLDTALYYALPSEIAKKQKSGARWILADAEEAFDASRTKGGSVSIIQQLLYVHPLYRHAKGSRDLNILVVGFGKYGQAFLDSVLQIGQMRNKRLNITVVSDDVTDKQLYLSERPEMIGFFDIDGSMTGSVEAYGSVTFSIARLERSDLSVNAGILQNLVLDHYESSPLHYVFVALGDDALNQSTARACQEVVDLYEGECYIAYVQEHVAQNGSSDRLVPVYVNCDISQTQYFKEIERMAFNTHLIWEKNLNIAARSVKAEFEKKYNYYSNISSVLSMKYKLFSMGIDLDEMTVEEAARQFCSELSCKKEIRDDLVWIEHRRWVTEKICLGWQRITDLNDCAYGITKDEKHKRHVCILRSRPERRLVTGNKLNLPPEKWDTATDEQLARLDELDRMSVELHRIYRQKADMVKKQNLLTGHTIATIRELITGNRGTTAAFQEWYTCLKDIWLGDSEKVFMYKGLKDAFLRSTDQLTAEKKNAVADQVKAFDRLFYPIRASMEYREWKKDDVNMIDNIPFVLTYSENAYMVIPYITGENSDVFCNVAAPTVVNPARVLYLYMIEDRNDVHALRKSLPYVIRYMQKKNLKSKIEMILLYQSRDRSVLPDNLEEELYAIGRKRILHPIKHIVYDSIESMPEMVSDYLVYRSKGKRLFALEKNRSSLTTALQVSGVYKRFANYQFDSADIQFRNQTGCDAFTYIHKSVFITVADMASFRLSSSESSNQPEFFQEYRDLWKKYTDNRGAWKALCSVLSDRADKQNLLVSFRKKNESEKSVTASEYRYILPFNCCISATRILDSLRLNDVIEADSFVSGYTTDSCEIRIVDRCGYKEKYDLMFSKVYALMDDNAISARLNTASHEVEVRFDSLAASGILLSNAKYSRPQELYSLLEYFNANGYIVRLKSDNEGKISFTYATRQIKGLLTTAGKMLEVYTYHKAKETKGFDDIVSSYELEWEDTPVKNEFDCILTRGFRTLFVECKARPNIEQDYYNKLNELATRFGINTIAVLIADTQEKPYYDSACINAMQRTRGRMMDIVTVWKPEDIDNIGHTLFKIIRGTYVSKEDV